MSLEEQFKHAEIKVATLSSRPDNNTLLLLYSYHKQVIAGDAPAEGPKNMFDIVGKAKYEAWCSQRGREKDECMKDYINLVEALKNK